MAKRHLKLRASLSDRFNAKAEPVTESGCWIWTGAVKEYGYGVIGLGRREEGIERAHRVAYRLYKGEIPTGLCVLHHCDTPACCNPAHLYLGTLKDNAQDMVQRGRLKLPDNRGERAKWAKLSEAAVRDIRQRAMTGPGYAKLYGVSKNAVYQIWSGNNWASVR
jgi:hypothetical protein